MRKRETACQVKNTPFDRIMTPAGIRMINGQVAETPEKLLEKRENNGRNDGRAIINTLQNVDQDNDDSI